MPSEPYDGQYAPVYVDAFEEPGRLLYRFDALIHNDGTTLDLYREADGSVMQVPWPAGQPTAEQHADERPAGRRRRRGRARRSSTSSRRPTRTSTSSRPPATSSRCPGRPPRVSGKIGFCMFDSFDIPGGDGRLVPAHRAVVPRAVRRSRLRADGALAGRRRPLLVPARVPVRRHHRAGSGRVPAARGRQPRGPRARGRRGARRHRGDADDPGGDGRPGRRSPPPRGRRGSWTSEREPSRPRSRPARRRPARRAPTSTPATSGSRPPRR